MPLTVDPTTIVLRNTQDDDTVVQVLATHGVHTLAQLIEHTEWTVVNWLADALGYQKERSKDKKQVIARQAINQLMRLREDTDRYCKRFEGGRFSPCEFEFGFRSGSEPTHAELRTPQEETP